MEHASHWRPWMWIAAGEVLLVLYVAAMSSLGCMVYARTRGASTLDALNRLASPPATFVGLTLVLFGVILAALFPWLYVRRRRAMAAAEQLVHEASLAVVGRVCAAREIRLPLKGGGAALAIELQAELQVLSRKTDAPHAVAARVLVELFPSGSAAFVKHESHARALARADLCDGKLVLDIASVPADCVVMCERVTALVPPPQGGDAAAPLVFARMRLLYDNLLTGQSVRSARSFSVQLSPPAPVEPAAAAAAPSR